MQPQLVGASGPESRKLGGYLKARIAARKLLPPSRLSSLVFLISRTVAAWLRGNVELRWLLAIVATAFRDNIKRTGGRFATAVKKRASKTAALALAPVKALFPSTITERVTFLRIVKPPKPAAAYLRRDLPAANPSLWGRWILWIPPFHRANPPSQRLVLRPRPGITQARQARARSRNGQHSHPAAG